MTTFECMTYINEHRSLWPSQIDGILDRLESGETTPAEELEWLDLYTPTNTDNS